MQLLSGEAIPGYDEILDLEDIVNSKIRTIHLNQPAAGYSQVPAIFVRKVSNGDYFTGSYDGIDFSVLNFSFSQKKLDSLLRASKDHWSIINYKHLFDRRSGIPTKGNNDILDKFFIERSDYEKQVRLIRNNEFWIAPESDVFKYLKEKEESSIQFSEFQDYIFLKVVNELDRSLYDHPLTILYSTSARIIRIKGSQEDGIYTNRTGTIRFSVMPNEEITIEILDK